MRGLISPDFRGDHNDMVDCIRSYLNNLTIPEVARPVLGSTTEQVPSQDTAHQEPISNTNMNIVNEGDEENPLRTQIDELLMQMSIQDDGQVSCR